MQSILSWSVAALWVVVALFVGYLRGYMPQKGQNLATHEDIEKLVDQVRAVTTAAKEIEAKISDDVWDRQKRWELKRDLLIDMVRKTMGVQVALQGLYAVGLTNRDAGRVEDVSRLKATHNSLSAFNSALNEYDQAKLVVDLVCGFGLRKALLVYEKLVSDLAQSFKDGDLDAYGGGVKDLLAREWDIVAEVRKELGSGPLLPVQNVTGPST